MEWFYSFWIWVPLGSTKSRKISDQIFEQYTVYSINPEVEAEASNNSIHAATKDYDNVKRRAHNNRTDVHLRHATQPKPLSVTIVFFHLLVVAVKFKAPFLPESIKTSF